MSIQDDYFYLSESLKDEQKDAFERIWEWGVDCENEVEKLRPIVHGIKSAIRMMFENDKNESEE